MLQLIGSVSVSNHLFSTHYKVQIARIFIQNSPTLPGLKTSLGIYQTKSQLSYTQIVHCYDMPVFKCTILVYNIFGE